MRRLALLVVAACAAAGALPASASAHGLAGRSDLPVPGWLAGWGAAAVLVISFVGLATLWSTPRLEEPRARVLLRIPRVLDVACGAIGVALFAGVVYAGFAGSQVATANALPTFVYVVFWVGLVPVSALLGDVFRAFNPWRAVGRALRLRGTRPYPERLGMWPAVAGLAAFGWLELVAPNHEDPSLLAAAALVYAAAQLAGMARYGVEAWSTRGDAFGVYFGLFAQTVAVRGHRRPARLRRPLSGLTELRPGRGFVALACTAIGDHGLRRRVGGAAVERRRRCDRARCVGRRARPGDGRRDRLDGRPDGVRRPRRRASTASGCAGSGRRRPSGPRPISARAFAHSLVPIALAYVVAHYFSMLAFQGQAAIGLASDPLGSGHDLFGTAHSAVDYTFLSAGVIWYIQVAALTAGHALGLTLAHDRALSSFRARPRGGPLAALDAHRHGRVHEPRPPPPLRLQRLMLPIAHAGHWIGSLLYVAPVALVALAIAFREMKGRTQVADGDDDLR